MGQLAEGTVAREELCRIPLSSTWCGHCALYAKKKSGFCFFPQLKKSNFFGVCYLEISL